MWKYFEALFRQTKLTERQRTGLWGEQQAKKHLAARGFTIIGERVRIGRRDEIDLVARDGQTLVFVEVKCRASEHYGRPMAAVDRAKRQRLARASMRYLKRLKTQPASFRFDVVEVIGKRESPNCAIRHIKNAFFLPRWYRVL